MLSLCHHRWSTLKTSYYDRWRWITIERCRKCALTEQASWTVRDLDGKMQTSCERSTVEITKKEQPHTE